MESGFSISNAELWYFYECDRYEFEVSSKSFKVHPQPETYWGHVNTIGPRACYDEGKRVAETMCYAYARQVNHCSRNFAQS